MIPKDFTNLPAWRRAEIERVALARQVGAFLCDIDKPADEREVVVGIAIKLAEDLAVEVRQALAFELRRAPELPMALAEKIARDVEEVSSPFLEHTTVFSPEQLARFARELGEHVRVAIAKRSHVPEVVAIAIAEAGGERSVTFLLRNRGAEIAGAGAIIIERFRHSRQMMDLLARRPDFPAALMADIIEHVSEAARRELVARYGVPGQVAEDATRFAKAANLARWAVSASYAALNDFIRQRESLGAFTERLLIDVTRAGGLRLFVAAMVHMTGLDLEAVDRITRLGSRAHLERLIKRAGIRGFAVGQLVHAVEAGRRREEALRAEDAGGQD
ncbi:MAG: hypothetical protein KatS3mg119_2461 [Rhodothalassiaceae bacterium]|nr:MAG: hypothetical protein KatS3mg119_2461 [Rhodothalassiaceae bacterium]